jgi:hypothetical protein
LWQRLNGAEAHLEFQLPTRKSVVGSLFMVITAWGVISTTAVTVFILSKDPDPDHRAIIKMGVGLILIWCVLGGLVMWVLRDHFVRWATRIPVGWRTRFVLLCIILAMLEEAVTTRVEAARCRRIGGVDSLVHYFEKEASDHTGTLIAHNQKDRLASEESRFGLERSRSLV